MYIYIYTLYIYIYTLYIYIHYIYIYINQSINQSIWIIVYPCGIVLDAFAERGISESWTNQ